MIGEHSMVITALFRRLGEILVHERMTTPDVVEKALARARTTGERVGEALVAMGAVKDDDVLPPLARQQTPAYLPHAEVADEHDQERVRHLHALGQHPDEGRREHEPRPARDEIAQRRQAFLMRGGDEQSTREIGGRRGGRKGQVC